MARAIHQRFIPNKVLLFLPADEAAPPIHRIAEFTKSMKSIDGKATAYVCRSYACELPTTEVDKMLELLNLDR